jgi:NADH:ubiquinone oxidoreductase subunit K
VTTAAYLFLGALLFTTGAFGTLARTSPAGRFVGIELMLAAGALTFVAAAAGFRELGGQVAALLILVIALAHSVAIGSALRSRGGRPE